MEDSLSISNYFIKKSLDEGHELTLMKLLKLVYLAHGWYLGLNSESLINEAVEAWKYGPVVPSVYNTFRSYGNSQITKLASTWTDQNQLITPMAEENKYPFLDKIWDVYKDYNGLELSTLTHQKGTPWDIVWNDENGKERQGAIIRNNLIQEHYNTKKSTTLA